MKRHTIVRLSIILGLVIILIIIGKFTAVGEWFDLENISTAIRESGPWGFLIFAALFALGSFIQIPAMLFVLAAILTYGQIEGTIYGFIGVVIAMTFNYYFIRMVGGKVLTEIRNRRLRKILSKLDKHPIRTIIILRLLLWASPFLNHVLAMTAVKPKDFIIGSAIGIVLPVAFFSGGVYFFKETIIPFIAG